MIASLPMYETAATRGAHDRFWDAIRRACGYGPLFLTRGIDPHLIWLDKTILLSQTCGLPYRSGLHGNVQLVGTPDFGVEGCAPGYYRSCLVVRETDLRGNLQDYADARLARNDPRSQSGWAAVVQHFRKTGQNCAFSSILDTGSHAASIKAVADGCADIAAIDAVTWALLARDTDSTATLRVLAKTEPTPGLPYITGMQEDAGTLFEAVAWAIAHLDDADRDSLMLKGLVHIPAEHYLSVPMP